MNDGPKEAVEYMWVNIVKCLLPTLQNLEFFFGLVGCLKHCSKVHLKLMKRFWQIFLYLHCYNHDACLESLRNSFSFFCSIKFNFIKALFSVCILAYCLLLSTN